MDSQQFDKGLISFLNSSPTPFHAVSGMQGLLERDGFVCLKEVEAWTLGPGKYFVTRNQSSIIAFVLGTEDVVASGIRLVGAHTDSPCLKVKPVPETLYHGYLQLGIEIYGGVLLNPWFDRDLALAGRLTVKKPGGTIANQLINIRQAVATIPSLAIHLDRDANNSRKVNPQTDMAPILLQRKEDTTLADLLTEYTQDGDEILSSELSFYDVNPARIIGMNRDFIAGARLDNLLSCYTGLMSLLEADTSLTSLLVCNDHEEVGSGSAAGAAGSFLKDVLGRIIPTASLHRALAGSLLISTDNAHGIHPNYADKHDSNHGPLLNRGPAIKYNANQRYATNSETAGYFKSLCSKADVPCQEFVNRADMACGSTIGPITATGIGVRTLDVGVPTFAMHSVRELAGAKDAFALHKVLSGFYRDRAPLGA